MMELHNDAEYEVMLVRMLTMMMMTSMMMMLMMMAMSMHKSQRIRHDHP